MRVWCEGVVDDRNIILKAWTLGIYVWRFNWRTYLKNNQEDGKIQLNKTAIHFLEEKSRW